MMHFGTGEPDSATEALATMGRDETTRRAMLQALRTAEQRLARRDYPVRDRVIGPVIDALHRDTGRLCLVLRQGIRFYFYYQGNIHRELVMAPDEHPDHVWEPQTTKLLLHLASDREARHVVIGGAYSGDHALLLAQLLHGHGTVHCFEPNGAESEQLAYNARHNSLENIRIERTGLWSRDDVRLCLSDTGDVSHAAAVVADTASDSFPAVSLATYGRDQDLDTIDLIMLDIEGGEHEALRGAAPYLAMPPGKAPDIVFEVHRHYVDWSDGLHRTAIVRELLDHGYTVRALRDFQGNWSMAGQPIELVPLETAYLEGPPHGFNMVAVKEPQRLSGPAFRVRCGVSPKYLRHRDPTLHTPIDD